MAEAPKRTAYQAKVYPLTPQQVQDILRSANREGWATDGQVVEDTKLTTNPLSGITEEVPQGTYSLSVRGPGGTNDSITLRQGEPTLPSGTPGRPQESWVVAQATAVPPKVAGSDRGPDTLTDKWGGQYQYDPSKPEGQRWTPVVAGDQSAYQTGAVGAAKSQAEYDEMQRNDQAGRGFMSTGDWLTLQLAVDRNQLSQDELKEKVRQFSETNRREWAAENRLGTTAAAQNQYTAAQTSGLGVETQMNQERLRQLIATAGSTEEKARLENELTKLQQQQARQNLAKPTITDLGTGPTYGAITPEGSVEERFRQGYVPKTLADVAARRGQLQKIGIQKRDELMAKVSESYTQEQAYADFNTWYDRNIDPQVPALQAAEQEAQSARGQAEATQRQASLQAAQGAGTQAINAYNAQNKNIVAPGFTEELGKVWNATAQGKRAGPIDYTKALQRHEPDLSQSAAQATAEALKYIDPTAAQMAGVPPPAAYQGMNPAQVLDRSNLFYGAGGPQTVPAPAPVQGQQSSGWDLVTGPQNMAQQPALPPGTAGTVAPGDPRYVGTQPAPPPTPIPTPMPTPYDWSATANVNSNLQELMRRMRENNVYAYGGAA